MRNLALAIWLESFYQSGELYNPQEQSREFVINDIICSSVNIVMREKQQIERLEKMVQNALNAFELEAFRVSGAKLN